MNIGICLEFRYWDLEFTSTVAGGREIELKESLMQNKICLITGATSGIGRAAAIALAEMGMSLILVGRNEGRAQAVLRQIRERIGNNNVEFIRADLSNQREVRELAGNVARQVRQAGYPYQQCRSKIQRCIRSPLMALSSPSPPII